MSDDTAYNIFTKLLLFVDRYGKFRTGRLKLARLTNKNPNTLYKALIRLEDEGMIKLESTSKFTDIHIRNWQKYQAVKNIPEHNTSHLSNTSGNMSITDEDELVSNSTSNTKVTTEQQQSNNKVTLEQELRIKNKNKEVLDKSNTAKVAKVPSADITEMFETWESIVGYKIQAGNQKNRFACSNLLKKFGRDGLTQLIRGVAQAQGSQYAPSISDFCSLQFKLNDLLAWGKKHSTKMSKVVEI